MSEGHHDHGGLHGDPSVERVRVLVVCWGNSARSLLAEALLRHLGGDRIEAHSAGIEPQGVHPLTLRVLAEANLSADGLAGPATIAGLRHGSASRGTTPVANGPVRLLRPVAGAIGDRVTNIAEDLVFLASGEVEDLNP